jgi:hypothetical protein
MRPLLAAPMTGQRKLGNHGVNDPGTGRESDARAGSWGIRPWLIMNHVSSSAAPSTSVSSYDAGKPVHPYWGDFRGFAHSDGGTSVAAPRAI